MGDDLIQVILLIIFGVVALLGRVLGRKKPQREPDDVVLEEEVTLPPWGNLPMEEEEPFPYTVEPETPSVQPPPSFTMPAPKETPVEPELKPAPARESRADSSPPQAPTIAGIPLSPQTFRQGIILAEILGRPKSLRRPR